MKAIPRRTGKTCLSEDELTLFDVLFYTDLPFWALRREDFVLSHQLPYNHSLADEALEATLHRLVASGELRIDPAPDGEPYYGLTEAGGRLWEAEREPAWDRFCMDREWEDEETGQSWVAVHSPSLETARRFLETAAECGRVSPDRVSLQIVDQEEDPLIPWRSFAEVWELRAQRQAGDGGDWHRYEARRTWWRDMSELATLTA